MDTKNRAFFWIFGVLILGAVTATFLRYFVFLSYAVQTEIDCDPEVENCYVYVCNPKEEDCTGDPEEDTWYYKVITKQAFNYPDCDPNEDEDCVIDCEVGEADCEIDLCDPTDPESGQECMTPEKYAELYPVEEGEEDIGEEIIEGGELGTETEEDENLTVEEEGEMEGVEEEGDEEMDGTAAGSGLTE